MIAPPALLLSLLLTLREVDDIDVWWHIRLARDFLRGADPAQAYLARMGPGATEQMAATRSGDLLFWLFQLPGDWAVTLVPLLCLLASLCLLARLFPKGETSWQTWFAAAAYQWLLPRNAVFSMPLMVLAVLIFRSRQTLSPTRRALAASALFLGWSTLHPSHLLGLGIWFLLALGSWIDARQRGEPLHWATITLDLILPPVCLALSALWNPFSRSLLALTVQHPAMVLAGIALIAMTLAFLPARHLLKTSLAGTVLGLAGLFWFLHRQIDNSSISLRPLFPADSLVPQPLQMTVHMLNQSLWQSSTDGFGSLDFFSPLSFPGDLHCWVWFLLSCGSACILLRRRPFSMQLFLPWLTLNLLALGYQRLTGAASLFCLFVLMSWESLPTRLLRPSAWLLNLLVLLQILMPRLDIGLFPSHRFGFGTGRNFPLETATWLDENLLNAPCFTTIQNGGYLSAKWKKRKSIFLDGFYAAHRKETLQLNKLSQKMKDFEPLRRNFHFSLALVGHLDRDAQAMLEWDNSWIPLLVDGNAILYGHVGHPDVQVFGQPIIALKKWQLNRASELEVQLWALALHHLDRKWRHLGASQALDALPAEKKHLLTQLKDKGAALAERWKNEP